MASGPTTAADHKPRLQGFVEELLLGTDDSAMERKRMAAVVRDQVMVTPLPTAPHVEAWTEEDYGEYLFTGFLVLVPRRNFGVLGVGTTESLFTCTPLLSAVPSLSVEQLLPEKLVPVHLLVTDSCSLRRCFLRHSTLKPWVAAAGGDGVLRPSFFFLGVTAQLNPNTTQTTDLLSKKESFKSREALSHQVREMHSAELLQE
ncbi:hypothetical protein HPB51_024311 [Rhipicephalus microplus]|uniref:Uncharacterized protein n=1 Tax=Rhipicephalus microplus TaxID=6941 RepID=A0A9J6DXZ4_RHIMP|nr:hypothetical protein HPB51_024311 [Rhipicephalus microplus]